MMNLKQTIALWMFLLAGVGTVWAQEPQLRAWLDRPVAQPGDSITVVLQLGLDGTPAPDLLGVSFKLDFDGARLVYSRHELGALFRDQLGQGQGDEIGPTLRENGDAGMLAYGLTLFDGEATALAAARGEVVRLRFHIPGDAEPGTAALIVHDGLRSSPAQPDTPILRVRADDLLVSATRRVRQAFVAGPSTEPVDFSDMDGLTVTVGELVGELLVAAERESDYQPEPPLAGDFIPMVDGRWIITTDGAATYAATMCVPYAQVDPRVHMSYRSAIRMLRRHEGMDWEELPTTLEPSAEAPDRVCAVTTQGGTFVVAAPAAAVPVAPTSELPAQIALQTNHPNPFRRHTTIAYQMPTAGAVRVAVYDLLGREVAVLAEGHQPAGMHFVRFNAGALPAGVYICRLEYAGSVRTRPMLHVP